MRKVAAVSVVLAAFLLTPGAEAQRVARSGLVPGAPSRTSTTPVVQGTGNAPTVRLFGGIATGDNSLDLGFMAGATFAWDLSGLPFDLRFDPSISRYSGDGGSPGVDVSLLLLNFPVAVEYVFPTTSSGGAAFHVMGGLGMHYSNWNVDTDVPGFEFGDSGLDMGITLGGGVRMNEKLGFEGRIIDIDSFTTIAILATWKLK
jgi:hypothetical protein